MKKQKKINSQKTISKNLAGQLASHLRVLEMNNERELNEYNVAGVGKMFF